VGGRVGERSRLTQVKTRSKVRTGQVESSQVLFYMFRHIKKKIILHQAFPRYGHIFRCVILFSGSLTLLYFFIIS
jgi:hypothetical protein